MLSHGQGIMTSRYACNWKFRKCRRGKRGVHYATSPCNVELCVLEVFSEEAFFGAGRRSSRRLLARGAAWHRGWILASLRG
eukprot:6071700-Pyramimonas_sp.AAC.1